MARQPVTEARETDGKCEGRCEVKEGDGRRPLTKSHRFCPDKNF